MEMEDAGKFTRPDIVDRIIAKYPASNFWLRTMRICSQYSPPFFDRIIGQIIQ
jgi:hypothetical protein